MSSLRPPDPSRVPRRDDEPLSFRDNLAFLGIILGVLSGVALVGGLVIGLLALVLPWPY